MKKHEQQAINEKVKAKFADFCTYVDKCLPVQEKDKKRLRTCSAWTTEIGHYTVLVSYQTIVAFIDNSTHEMYDILRYIYGYTATSAQHISKFAHDFDHVVRYTYKAI